MNTSPTILKNFFSGAKIGSKNPPIAPPAAPPTIAPAAPAMAPAPGMPVASPRAAPTAWPAPAPIPAPSASEVLPPAAAVIPAALMPAPAANATLPNLVPENFLNLSANAAAFFMLRMPLPRVIMTQDSAFTVATGFLRNAIPTKIGAADNTNCTAPKNPLRLIGFSRNLINPSSADPVKNSVILKMNLPRA